MSKLDTFLYLAPIILASLVLHELAHAYVATRLGDPTPREHGRLTLNPLVHLDPLGTAMFAITYFYSSSSSAGRSPCSSTRAPSASLRSTWRSSPRPAPPPTSPSRSSWPRSSTTGASTRSARRRG